MRKVNEEKELKITLMVFALYMVIAISIFSLILTQAKPELREAFAGLSLCFVMLLMIPMLILIERLKHKFGCVTWTESTTDFTDAGILQLFIDIEQHRLKVVVITCGAHGLTCLRQSKHFDPCTEQELHDMGYRGEFWGAFVLFNQGQEDIRASSEPEFDMDAFYYAIDNKKELKELYYKLRYEHENV